MNKKNNNYFIAVTYHYIGDEKKFKKGIYPVSPARLARQIDSLKKKFELIGEKELIEFLDRKKKFNKKPGCILTFDDGLKCQYLKALPILKKKKVPAIFFINSHPLVYGKMCLVHKIHYLLAKIPAEKLLAKMGSVYKNQTGRALIIGEEIREKAIRKKVYDDEQTAIFKYLVNHYLPTKLVGKIIDDIFAKFFGDERKFAKKLYIGKKELKVIESNKLPLYLGLHTASHIDISITEKSAVETDIIKNYEFLKTEVSLSSISGFSYPFGAMSKEELKNKLSVVIRKLNLKYAFTTYRGRNYLSADRFLLKRFDANDVPEGKRPLREI